ncbi:MAG: hypothetical protein JOZ69_19145, partial [Myxococcales bacterium]|nr:hypothetical protein [Myxococcales bacterium]
IAEDDPTLAGDIVFPRDGWLATRDALEPGSEWEKEISQPFERSLHALARQRGAARLDGANAVSLELGHVLVQATPRKHGWKKPVWIVRGSRLTFVVAGRLDTISVRELTAWRGAWYVTRLR